VLTKDKVTQCIWDDQDADGWDGRGAGLTPTERLRNVVICSLSTASKICQ